MYNTEKDNLIIREYGRNTQNLINHAKTIEDKEERQAYIEKVIKLIISMYPNTKNVEDYRLKVWSHVLQMADYELDVEVPVNVPSTKARRIPDRVPYPKVIRKYRHYGRNVRTLINKAKDMEDPEMKKEFVDIIGSYMKMAYKEWNRENVDDEVIYEEFAELSNGEIVLDDDSNIDSLLKQRSVKRNYSASSYGKKGRNDKKRRNNNNNKSKKTSKNQRYRKR